MKKTLLLLLCAFCLSGCTNLPPENESLEKLKQVYDVIDNDFRIHKFVNYILLDEL